MRKILIIGATSAIAQATAKLFAQQHHALFLVGRDADKLEAIAADLKVRGAHQVDYTTLDLNEFDKHSAMLEEAYTRLEGLDTVLIAHGILDDQKAGEQDYAKAEQALRTNFLSVVSLLTPIANRLEKQHYGCIAVISSVAGDRGRQSNYIYGTAKGALTLFLQGLRNRLHPANVCVLTIKPGFVDTPMTASLKKGALWAEPESIARGIYRAIEKRKNSVYLPWFWWIIMTVIRHIPEPIFKRMKL
ncbi:MAG: short-chain dehydrogenase [Gammaproteobacteria bacterium]|nr:MAG: short-chain dehydrogenase [Gammaproteobacteria bacterium]RKZ36705.1 MAG: short-chain dehydrogenase [Gammaproteobacteria bacterium]RKZ73266.1 MAG: short-chain dehydrogenase [Gammaproteobacteria bacterium]